MNYSGDYCRVLIIHGSLILWILWFCSARVGVQTRRVLGVAWSACGVGSWETRLILKIINPRNYRTGVFIYQQGFYVEGSRVSIPFEVVIFIYYIYIYIHVLY